MKRLPVLIGLVLIAATFQALNPYFLTPRNLTNLVLVLLLARSICPSAPSAGCAQR